MHRSTVPGIVRFINDKKFAGAKLGLLTNSAGILPDGTPNWLALESTGYQIKALFGPEHGFLGNQQDAVKVGNLEFAGLKVISLYGNKLKPTPDDLMNLDLMVIDLQDAGCRFYTYLYTLAYAMEACAVAGKKIVVCDRPNPINANVVEGAPIPRKYRSFVGDYGLPARHGLTIGEFAGYLKKYFIPAADLEVIKMNNYTRTSYFDETGLPWSPPSPNLPTPATALVYPGTCLFEGTSFSEGRGTTRPFEMIGAPGIDVLRWRQKLLEHELPGVIFAPVYFTPTFSKSRDQPCQGIMLHVTSRLQFQPFKTGLAMLYSAFLLFPNLIDWKPLWEDQNQYFIDKLAGGPELREMINANFDFETLYVQMTQGGDPYAHKREKSLLY